MTNAKQEMSGREIELHLRAEFAVFLINNGISCDRDDATGQYVEATARVLWPAYKNGVRATLEIGMSQEDWNRFCEWTNPAVRIIK